MIAADLEEWRDEGDFRNAGAGNAPTAPAAGVPGTGAGGHGGIAPPRPGRRLLDAPWTLFGLLPAALGVAVSLAGVRGFRRAGTPATPFQTPERLVTTGVYGFTRNPMYLGPVLVLVGAALLLGSLTPWAVVPAFALLLDRRSVRAEEAMLAIRFGSAWTAYRGRVRRWL